MKILIIDDEPLVRRSLSRAFQTKGHQIFEAGDGWQGLLSWKENAPDLIFVDVLMPGLKGPEVIQKADAFNKGKIVLMTAYSGEEIPVEQTNKASLFLKKPFENIFDIVSQAEGLFK
jgi:two-component system, response regulator PdtaR